MHGKQKKIPTKNSKYVLKNQLTESRGFVEKQNFCGYKDTILENYKVEYVIPMVVVSILSHPEFGPNDHGEDTPHFTKYILSSFVPFKS